eukprot:TRINITY_DN2331_c0_g1_i3.p1 TRINITY_DN2331_c0_g1~~TRINITY_DN2331_c0_g1_i3.p1  ORF type:complete len:1707 (-),score=196.17 TRINITY_DN2331_c0_g1_i3:149-5269(-)
MVHPMLKQDAKVSYEGIVKEDAPLTVFVDGEQHTVRVFRHDIFPQGPHGPRTDFLLLSHPMFEARTKEGIYPNPMSRRSVLQFFSLWNQAVGALIVRLRPHIYHCPDFHTALAIWYAVDEYPEVKMLLVLHNAEYQGTISTNMIQSEEAEELSSIFNLTEDAVRDHLVQEGRFNMLKPAVDYICEEQDGYGVVAVSDYYAKEVYSSCSVLWHLPSVKGLDNPMLEQERPTFDKDLLHQKAIAKREIQTLLGLNIDPDARLFVCLGRLVRQKGVDLLADIAPWLLDEFPNAQLCVVGPIGDGFGYYASAKLQALANQPEYKGRLFVKCEFWRCPPALKFAADFCVMPSRDEPFGYVDIEFAWHGAVMVGAQAGGLGKVPGFYYVAQNRENLDRLRKELKGVVARALTCPQTKLNQMARAAVTCRFPLATWQHKLLKIYGKLVPPGTEAETPASIDFARVPLDQSYAEARRRGYFVIDSTTEMDGDCAHVDEDDEFLIQELDEEALSEKIKEKLDEDPDLQISQVLEQVGHDMDLSRETNRITRWLLQPTCGILRVHWCVCLGYIMSPCSSLVAVSEGSLIATRGGETLFVSGLPNQVPSMVFFSVDALAYAFGLPFWALLVRYCEPRKVMGANMMLKLPILLCLLAPADPNEFIGIAIVFVNGFVAAGSLLFITFNFMMTINADMTRTALRMGALQMCTYLTVQVLTAYVWFSNPDSIGGSVNNVLPWEVKRVFIPLIILIGFLTFIPGIFMLFAPGPYRDDRFPGWDLSLIFKRKSFLWLSISDAFGALGAYASSTYMYWWLLNGWTTTEMAGLSLISCAVLLVGTLIWAASLSAASKHGLGLLLGFTIMLAPPTMLRAIAQEEVASYTLDDPKNKWLVGICMTSVLLEGVRSSAIWSAKIRILNSRWRVLSYATVTLSIISLISAASPWLSELWSYRSGGSFIENSTKMLADAVLRVMMPVYFFQFLAQVLAAPFIRGDIGLPTKTQRGARTGWKKTCRKYAFAVLFTSASLMIISMLTSEMMVGEPELNALMRPCRTNVVPDKCEILFDEFDASGPGDGIGFGKNMFGQTTTAKHNCIRKVREHDGDTFVYWENRCRVLRCGQDNAVQNMNLTSGSADFEVWSIHCPISQDNLVMVQLLEWKWTDIARECENYLGPAGFDVVQTSPPQEHILGDSWAVRYQPVSYELDSRSGTQAEFIDMVRRCKAVGVGIMVDAVINHMAGLYIQADPYRPEGRCNPDPAPPGTSWEKTFTCEGWHGTKFGDREFLFGRKDLDLFTKSDFHHYPGNNGANCGYGILCDMVGMPDINTESASVQHMLSNYMGILNAIGVTYIRIDAGAWIYPDSIQRILMPYAWDYIVQEYYITSVAPSQVEEASKFSHLTEMQYGNIMAELLFDSYEHGQWVDRTAEFGKLMQFRGNGGQFLKECNLGLCSVSYPPEKTLQFVDNHDSQRERWKHEQGGPPSSPMCEWNIAHDVEAHGGCRPMYKHGLTYRTSFLWLLASPFSSNSVRLMSSYAFETFSQGPPGVLNGSLHVSPTPVYADMNSATPSGCRSTPKTSPVTEAYDTNAEKQWICEHRWSGVPGFIRLRKLLGRNLTGMSHTFSNETIGLIAFSVNSEAFFVFTRGFNWYTGTGWNTTTSLAGIKTALPQGSYCNLAGLSSPVPPPGRLDWKCENANSIFVDELGVIADGNVSGGENVAIHVAYRG